MNKDHLKANEVPNPADGEVVSQLTEVDDSFSVFHEDIGNHITIGNVDENVIIFLLRGRIEIKKSDGSSMLLMGNRMYCMSCNHTPYHGDVLHTAVYIILKTDSLLPYIDKQTIQKVKKYKSESGDEIGALDIEKMLRFFLASIVFLKNNDLKSNVLFALKRQELLFISRKLYPQEELIRFIKPAIVDVSEFRLEVMSKYTNSITVKELASECFMIPKTFTKYFKDEFGETPHKWIMDRKINNLNNFFFYKGATIDDILKEFGFVSLSELNKFCVRYQLINILSVTRGVLKNQKS